MEYMKNERIPAPAELLPRELLINTFGHGWEERWYIGDDEDPESFTLEECVWIGGYIMTENGSSANVESDWWVENYGKQYGIRIWLGENQPTEEQRKNTPWTQRTVKT